MCLSALVYVQDAWRREAGGRLCRAVPLDQQGEAEQHYLDSVQNLPVYNLGFRKFTYKECKEKELNLGLTSRAV